MNYLSQNQTDFLLTFFVTDSFAGWKGIATMLIEKGSCIVSNEKHIWRGGIGNFIKVTDLENSVNCFLYKFDLNEFIKTPWFMNSLDNHLKELYTIKEITNSHYNEMLNFSKLEPKK